MRFLYTVCCFTLTQTLVAMECTATHEKQSEQQKNGLPLEKMKPCAHCKTRTIKLCAGCNLTPYCSRECQVKQWSSHKPRCKELAEQKIATRYGELKYALLTMSSSVLADIRGLQREFNAQLPTTESVEDYVKAFQKLFSTYELRHPLFCLTECMPEGVLHSYCPYDRIQYPQIRKDFEEIVAAHMVDKVNNSKGFPVHCTFFNSSGLFQELMIMLKVLMQVPEARVTVHLIDNHYNLYCRARALKENSYVRDVSSYSTIISEVLTFMPFILKGENDAARLVKDCAATQWDYVKNCLWVEGITKQFTSCLKALFPKAQIAVQVHDLFANYLNYLATFKLPHPDIVTAIDIDTNKAVVEELLEEYTTLYIATLQHKPNSQNFLALDYNGVKLHSYRLDTDITIPSKIPGKALGQLKEKLMPLPVNLQS